MKKIKKKKIKKEKKAKNNKASSGRSKSSRAASKAKKNGFKAMEQKGKKNKKKKQKNGIAVLTGTMQKHARGFGFVSIENEEEDIYISAANMNTAMEGDIVEVDLFPPYLWEKSKEGMVTNIVQRKYEEIVGTLYINGKFGFVVPDDKKLNDDIFILGRYIGKAKDGDKVVAKITKYPEGKLKAEGKIIEIVSRKGEANGEVKALMRQQNLRETFPSRACAEAKAMSRQVITDEIAKGRVDLRDKMIVTIDGKDSKDFDDAVIVEKMPNGNYLLGVHIADVAHYVAEDGPLDQEALKRGNSVYLLNTVVPMLPKELSNGICSLNPEEDRLTLSCDMEISPSGELVDYKIYEGIIRSKKRLVYDDVSDIIENPERNEEYDYIYLMAELAEILSKKKKDRGSLDFDLDEANIKLDENGKVLSITVAERRSANRLIEEFMLMANETVARHFEKLDLPFVYRVHENPSMEKLEELKVFLKNFGILMPNNLSDIKPKDIADILKKVEGEDYENVINTVTLRSMQKARYEVECSGHFGLALTYYCHFTSPIRRYADLFIHRVIKYYLHNELNPKKIKELKYKAEEVARITSSTERDAIELERQVEKLKMAEYMEDYIGEEFEGVISGVSNFGVFVELPNTVEGLVRLTDMNDDYYEYIPEKYCVVGKVMKRVLALGDRVRVEVQNVSVSSREIDFYLIKKLR